MRAALAVAAIGTLVMAVGIAYGFVAGGGWAEVRELAQYPWFVVSIVDVYVGFALFACWIAMRERVVAAAAWIIALLLLGNLVSCVYAVIALQRARSGTKPLFG